MTIISWNRFFGKCLMLSFFVVLSQLEAVSLYDRTKRGAQTEEEKYFPDTYSNCCLTEEECGLDEE